MDIEISVPRYEGVRGLPARAVTLTNTERAKAMCPRRWWFRYVERLQTVGSRPLSFGNAWHACLEDVHTWWMCRDSVYPGPGDGVVCVWCGGSGRITEQAQRWSRCNVCDGSGKGPAGRYEAELRAATLGDDALYTGDEISAEVQRLTRAFAGWLHKYGAEPYTSYRVLAVELPIARPIVNPRSGRSYAPMLHYVREGASEEGGTLRLASTGEVSGAADLPPASALETHRWPWHQVAKLDCVLQHRRSGVIYVGEWKSSTSPRTLIEGLNVDPQTDGYVWVLRHAVNSGLLGSVAGDVRGYLYDVTSSTPHLDPAQLAPKPVKVLGDDGQPVKKGSRYVYELDADGKKIERSPGLSKATNKTIPSWRYAAAVERLGLPACDYVDVIAEMRARVDPRLYMREWGSAGDEVLARYSEEVYAAARRHADMHRKAARATDLVDLNVAFPRVPVCRLPGGQCSYRGPCAQDGEEARQNYQIADAQTWETSP